MIVACHGCADEKLALQSSLPKHADPAFTTAEIVKKNDVVDRVCKPIATKPAPKPAPKPEPAPAPAAEQPAAEAAPMDAEAASAEAEQQPMEQ